jgi:hypothetical protein
MSTLSQFAPFAGGGLKSFQTGYSNSGATQISLGTNHTEDAAYYDVTISSVSTSKTITGFQGNIGGYESYYGTQSAMIMWNNSSPALRGTSVASTRLTSATNLRISTAFQNGFPIIKGRWQAVEAN